MIYALATFAVIAAVSGVDHLINKHKASAVVFAIAITAFAVLGVIGGGV